MMMLSKKTFYILAAAVLLISGVAQSKVVKRGWRGCADDKQQRVLLQCGGL